MRTFVLTIIAVLLAGLCLAQDPTRETILDADSDDKVVVKKEINRLVDEWVDLSTKVEEFSDANAVIRKTAFDTRITECTTRRDAAANQKSTDFWQAMIDKTTAKRDRMDDNTPSTATESHPRWEANQLTSEIADLVTDINDLKSELAAVP